MTKPERVEPHEYYTDDDIGREVKVIVENICYTDVVVEVYLPDGQRVIGPRLKCAHLFARFSMIPAMEAHSEVIQKAQEDGV
jgi:hypothetical protein